MERRGRDFRVISCLSWCVPLQGFIEIARIYTDRKEGKGGYKSMQKNVIACGDREERERVES